MQYEWLLIVFAFWLGIQKNQSLNVAICSFAGVGFPKAT